MISREISKLLLVNARGSERKTCVYIGSNNFPDFVSEVEEIKFEKFNFCDKIFGAIINF